MSRCAVHNTGQQNLERVDETVSLLGVVVNEFLDCRVWVLLGDVEPCSSLSNTVVVHLWGKDGYSKTEAFMKKGTSSAPPQEKEGEKTRRLERIIRHTFPSKRIVIECSPGLLSLSRTKKLPSIPLFNRYSAVLREI